MTPEYAFVVDDLVLELFMERSKREREELLRIFKSLADSPYQTGDWRQKTKSGRELQVKRFGKWLITYWLGYSGNFVATQAETFSGNINA